MWVFPLPPSTFLHTRIRGHNEGLRCIERVFSAGAPRGNNALRPLCLGGGGGSKMKRRFPQKRNLTVEIAWTVVATMVLRRSKVYIHLLHTRCAGVVREATWLAVRARFSFLPNRTRPLGTISLFYAFKIKIIQTEYSYKACRVHNTWVPIYVRSTNRK